MNFDTQNEIRLTGISASPGICIGKAYLVDKEGVDIIKRYSIGIDRVKDEKNRFKTAVKHAEDELRSIIENTPEDFRQNTKIIETHLVVLKDKMLYEKTLDTITSELVNAEWALKTVTSDVKSMFASMDDDYFKERISDIGHVSERIMRNLMGAEEVNIGAIDKRVILVANDLSPAETSQIQLERIMGFVTNLGGKASHTSIIARTLAIPAVQGVSGATGAISTDDLIIVDGTQGVVIVHPEENTLIEFIERQQEYERQAAVLARLSHLPAETKDGTLTKIMGNIELPEEIVTVLDHGGDGIGLFRTEFQYLSRPTFPSEDQLYEQYKDVVDVLAPRPLTIRTLDINGDKAVANTCDMEEANPALGLRGIRYCLKKPEVFITQLRAILRAAAHGPIRAMFPMISTVEEIRQAKALLKEAEESLKKEGIPYGADMEVGIMIEVPSAVVMADVFAREVDFFSIGTNDLIQYSLAIDRGNRSVNHLFQPLDPAIIRMLHQVAKAARENGTALYMCGEMASYPIHVPVLLGMGITELSMNPQAIPAVKNMIRALDFSQTQEFIKEVLKPTTANDVFDLVEETYGSLARKVMSPEDE